MSQTKLLPRPAFWKVPDYIHDTVPMGHIRTHPTGISTQQQQQPPQPHHYHIQPTKGLLKTRRTSDKCKKRVRFKDNLVEYDDEYDHHAARSNNVQVGSPAFGEVLRGDVISKIGEYDARDLSHADAQTLFRTAGNEIRIVVHRDSKIAYTQGLSGDNSRPNSSLLSISPDPNQPHRAPSPFLPGPGQYEHALQVPVDTLPHTVFPKLNESGGYVVPSTSFVPMPTRDHQQDVAEEQAAIVNQPYRTTPLVLPGAKVKKDAPTTDSYLRHYPNPAVRAHPHHDVHDSVMKQRVADTMLHRVVGQDADTGKVFHKQFNSPIGLYSENNIESTIRQTVPVHNVRKSALHRPLPTKLDGYKQTLVYDPSKSETYRAIQEAGYDLADHTEEVTVPVQPRVFQPHKMVPGKKLLQSAPVRGPSYNVVNTTDDTIRQSGSFNRLMYSVLGASNY